MHGSFWYRLVGNGEVKALG